MLLTNLTNYANQAKGLEGVQDANHEGVMVQDPAQIFHNVNPNQMQGPVMINAFDNYPYQPMQTNNNGMVNQPNLYNNNNSMNANPYQNILIQPNFNNQQRGPILPPINRASNFQSHNPYIESNQINNIPQYGNMNNMNAYIQQNPYQNGGFPMNQNVNQGYPQFYANNQAGNMNNNNFQNPELLQRNKPNGPGNFNPNIIQNIAPTNYNTGVINLNFTQDLNGSPNYQG